MLDKIKKVFTKKKPAAKKPVEQKVVSNMDDLDTAIAINKKPINKQKETRETKSSLTFGK